ncbi:hypothetical protein OH77DRAFT_1524881 [Trametes cingulata]|nr:hypothetical protein OH77DRAFT_1524881 [Trametes cingulata]
MTASKFAEARIQGILYARMLFWTFLNIVNSHVYKLDNCYTTYHLGPWIHSRLINSRVFILEGKSARAGTVTEVETIEGLRFVVIRLDPPDEAQADGAVSKVAIVKLP